MRFGCARGEAPLGYAKPNDDGVIEYDEQSWPRWNRRTTSRDGILMTRKPPKPSGTTAPTRLSKARFTAMAEEATVDAHGESEQATGWFTMFEEHLQLPFETKVLGTAVTVASIDLRDSCQIVAICRRGRDRQAILLVDLPLPSPKPAGTDWIEAYRYWLGPR